MDNQKSQNETLERIVEIAKKAMKPNEYTEGKPYLQWWIKTWDELAKPKWLYRHFPFLETKAKKQEREKAKENAELCRKVYHLFEEIVNRQEDTIRQVRKKLFNIEQEFKKQNIRIPPEIGEMLFQYEDVAKQRLSFILETKPEDVDNYVTSGAFQTLCDYAQQYPELSREVIRKIGDVYRAHIKRKKTLGPLFYELVLNCINAIEELGRSLGLQDDEAYKLAGLTRELIEEHDKEWQD